MRLAPTPAQIWAKYAPGIQLPPGRILDYAHRRFLDRRHQNRYCRKLIRAARAAQNTQ